MNFIHMKYSQYTDTDLHSYVQILTNWFNITHLILYTDMHPYISPISVQKIHFMKEIYSPMFISHEVSMKPSI